MSHWNCMLFCLARVERVVCKMADPRDASEQIKHAQDAQSETHGPSIFSLLSFRLHVRDEVFCKRDFTVATLGQQVKTLMAS